MTDKYVGVPTTCMTNGVPYLELTLNRFLKYSKMNLIRHCRTFLEHSQFINKEGRALPLRTHQFIGE